MDGLKMHSHVRNQQLQKPGRGHQQTRKQQPMQPVEIRYEFLHQLFNEEGRPPHDNEASENCCNVRTLQVT